MKKGSEGFNPGLGLDMGGVKGADRKSVRHLLAEASRFALSHWLLWDCSWGRKYQTCSYNSRSWRLGHDWEQ